jgi:hypothetical protein
MSGSGPTADTTPPALVRTDRVASDLENCRCPRAASCVSFQPNCRSSGRDVCASFLLRSRASGHRDWKPLIVWCCTPAPVHSRGPRRGVKTLSAGTWTRRRDGTRRAVTNRAGERRGEETPGLPDEDCRFGALLVYLYRAFTDYPPTPGRFLGIIQPSIPVPELLFWNLDGCPCRSNRQEQKMKRSRLGPKAHIDRSFDESFRTPLFAFFSPTSRTQSRPAPSLHLPSTYSYTTVLFAVSTVDCVTWTVRNNKITLIHTLHITIVMKILLIF